MEPQQFKTLGITNFKEKLQLSQSRKRLCFSAAIFLPVFFFCLIFFQNPLPDPLFSAPFSSVILDRDGKLLGASIAKDEQWRFPPDAKIPERFVHAITAYEDRRFFFHPGIDPLAIIRSLWLNIRSGRIVSGASTITMQVIRLSRQGRPRTFWEKLIETALAFRLESALSKTEILALYASHAPFGGNVVGLRAGAWRYFGRAPDKLSWAETAMLAVLPNSPALIHPGRNRERLLWKRNRLLDRLHQDKVIDALSCKLAKKEALPPAPVPIPMLSPHLLARVRKESVRQARERGGNVGKYQSSVRTTLRKDIQIRTTEIVIRHHRRLAGNGIHNAAALLLEVETGDILAYVGNIPVFNQAKHGNYMDIITASRSTGSILKPLLYAAMMDSGELLPTQLVPDIPTRMGGFAPENYSRTYQGAVPASMALARSLNIPAVRMLRSYGVDRFYALLKTLGMTTLHRPASDYGLALILGGAEGTLWDITGIYAGMARCVNQHQRSEKLENPIFFEPRYVAASDEKKSAVRSYAGVPLTAGSCWLALQAMLEVVRPGGESAWRSFASSRKIAWKTGTSYGLRDGWAVGVTPKYAAGVWVGNADGDGRPGLTGITTAAPILFEIFGMLDLRGWFALPETDLVSTTVCEKSGYRAGPYCKKQKQKRICVSGLRSERCPYCKMIHCDSDLEWQVHSECERVADIRAEKWFVLPPAMEWFYKRRHSDYRTLPPYRNDCLDVMPGAGVASLTLIYPGKSGRIYVPLELDGRRGRSVFEVAHREPRTTVFWHLDDQYIGETRDIHQMALAPEPGRHTLTLVDENGAYLERRFTVLSKD